MWIMGRVRTRLVGATARRLLETPGCSGHVLAVVSNAVYLASAGGDIFWVALDGVPLHSRGVTASIPLRTLGNGMPFAARDGRLTIGEAVEVDMADAPTWTPPRVSPEGAAPLSEVRRRLAHVLRALAPEQQSPISAVVSLLARPEDADEMSLLFAREASASVERMASACLEGDVPRAVAAGEGLLGLGPGLTPAGDDFIGGMLFGMRALQSAYPERYARDDQPIRVLLERAKAQTNRISHTILSDLAMGEGPEPLHDLTCCLLSEGRCDRLMLHIQHVWEMGHSSGRALLAGTLTGLLLACVASPHLTPGACWGE